MEITKDELEKFAGRKILDSQFEVFKILYDKGINLPLYGYKNLQPAAESVSVSVMRRDIEARLFNNYLRALAIGGRSCGKTQARIDILERLEEIQRNRVVDIDTPPPYLLKATFKDVGEK